MNAKNVLTRLQVVEEKLSIAQEDEEREAEAEKVTELLRQYEELMVERRKLPVEEQRRLEEQEMRSSCSGTVNGKKRMMNG